MAFASNQLGLSSHRQALTARPIRPGQHARAQRTFRVQAAVKVGDKAPDFELLDQVLPCAEVPHAYRRKRITAAPPVIGRSGHLRFCQAVERIWHACIDRRQKRSEAYQQSG